MSSIVHASPYQIDLRHQASMMASLSYRLKVALETQNFQLVELLEREKQQIESDSSGYRMTRSLMGWLEVIQGFWAELTWSYPELKFYEYANGTDYWWYTFDPQTGRCIYADSEAELRLWVKENLAG
jgi:hypothetical protein